MVHLCPGMSDLIVTDIAIDKCLLTLTVTPHTCMHANTRAVINLLQRTTTTSCLSIVLHY